MSLELIKKYDQPGPRYTSYPPLPFWNHEAEQERWLKDLQAAYKVEGAAQLYLHIPYCEQLCYYCGCNRVISKEHSSENKYIQALLSEWSIYVNTLGKINVNGIHLGGGTPTYLSPDNLRYLITELKATANFTQDFYGTIEVDPRVTTLEHLKVIADLGFKRISMGIQDFDPNVQKAINRIQPFEKVKEFTQMARDLKIPSINFDLIFGLPLQTEESIRTTMSLVTEIKPDTIAFYSYAHVPWKIKHQKILEKYEMASGHEKMKFYETGKEILLNSNYEELGFDHFTLQEDPLYIAYKDQSLQRNFMGYTTKSSNILIGLGASSISSSKNRFVQNEKNASKYIQAMEEKKLCLVDGHIHSELDFTIEEIVQSIMCQNKADLKHLLDLYSSEMREMVLNKLEELKSDQLITFDNNYLEVTKTGKDFLRPICMALDFYLLQKENKEKPNQFSRTI